MQGDEHDIIFIRHAESKTNAATEDFVNRTNVVYDWHHLSQNKEFLTGVKYNLELLDAHLTPLGEQQVTRIPHSARMLLFWQLPTSQTSSWSPHSTAPS